MTSLRATLLGGGKQTATQEEMAMVNVPPIARKIIETANELATNGKTGSSTSETIAAAFVLDRMDFIPDGYSVVEAWDRIDDLQEIVRKIRSEYEDLVVPW
ncbi:hypothetical protein [Marinibactrum halimedae]|uniref:Uncharacterized protein n=1 Tax=Marinibactrum halimedae TaxID=1444977 RepID=A0AA37T3Y2_9GAMM|nr:hypothetical protein [Marinibactrum halimedae]MCD9461162.1 hypothetical protein [Marinibactrum halimedae]MCD9461168.1 hypothetical protein [Marinibactrum halimedae]GLS24602.1 hypothetical protein GCM10007877_03160 [Marinibactrum halimedae]